MKKWSVFVCMAVCAVMLCACTAPVQTAWETVDDEIVADCAVWQEDAMTICFDVPADAVEQHYAHGGTRQVYSAEDGAYEIVSEILLDASVDSVVRTLTGFAPERIAVVETAIGDLREYRFAWYAGGDEGGRLYRADAVLDEPYCYVLLFSSSEQSGTTYDSTAASVFASMALTSGDEV